MRVLFSSFLLILVTLCFVPTLFSILELVRLRTLNFKTRHKILITSENSPFINTNLNSILGSEPDIIPID